MLPKSLQWCWKMCSLHIMGFAGKFLPKEGRREWLKKKLLNYFGTVKETCETMCQVYLTAGRISNSLFTKLSLVVAQGQKYGKSNYNWTHLQRSANLVC